MGNLGLPKFSSTTVLRKGRFDVVARVRPILEAMPEGHIIHHLANAISSKFGGEKVGVASPQGRFSTEAAELDGGCLVAADAVGKHLLIDFEADRTVWIHLGLIGKLRLLPFGEVASPETLRLRIFDDAAAMELRGPQWCRLIDPLAREKVLATSGPDPLRDDADPEKAWAKVRRSAKPIAVVLLDQAAFAGVGNIYRAEVLFRHGIDPLTPAKQITREVFDSMWADLVALMKVGERGGVIDTVAARHMPEEMGREPRVDAHGGEVYVYRRLELPCLVCGTPVRETALAGRNLFWCPTCQPQGATGTPLRFPDRVA